MISILTHEPNFLEPPAPTRVEEAAQSEAAAPVESNEEFEIVLGRRQVASVLFVATVVIVMFSAFSYLAGEVASPKKAAPVAVATPAPVPTPAPAPAPVLQATVVEAPPKPDAPIFATPQASAIYLQMGAVEKGIAVIFAEGLRKHGFDAFVAPGPNDHIFRVLIGPLPDPQAYERAKEATDRLGLSTFGKKYPEPPVARSLAQPITP